MKRGQDVMALTSRPRKDGSYERKHCACLPVASLIFTRIGILPRVRRLAHRELPWNRWSVVRPAADVRIAWRWVVATVRNIVARPLRWRVVIHGSPTRRGGVWPHIVVVTAGAAVTVVITVSRAIPARAVAPWSRRRAAAIVVLPVCWVGPAAHRRARTTVVEVRM